MRIWKDYGGVIDSLRIKYFRFSHLAHRNIIQQSSRVVSSGDVMELKRRLHESPMFTYLDDIRSVLMYGGGVSALGGCSLLDSVKSFVDSSYDTNPIMDINPITAITR